MQHRLMYVVLMNNENGAAIENIPASFEGRLIETIKEINRAYERGKQNENPFSLPLRWETEAKIKLLKKAKAILDERNGTEKYRLGIEAIEQKCADLSTRLSWTKKPKGVQIDFVLGFWVYRLAELIKGETGQYDWPMLANLLAKHLEGRDDISRNTVLKLHRRFSELLKNKEKYRRAVIANAKFLTTKEEVARNIAEARTKLISADSTSVTPAGACSRAPS
jgi:hypothetical protein